MRTNTVLFPIMALVVFGLIAFTFPFITREFIGFDFGDHWRGGGRARFDLVIWMLLNALLIVVYYLTAAWLIRRTAGLTGVHTLRSTVLWICSLAVGGYVLYNLWRSANPADASIRRIILSVLIAAIVAVGLRATRTDPEAEWDVEQEDANGNLGV